MTTEGIRGIVRLYPERMTQPTPWLLALQRDLARDTAESAFTELFAGQAVTADMVERVLHRLIDRIVDLMVVAYRELGISDPTALEPLRHALGLAFLERFDELTANLERGGLA